MEEVRLSTGCRTIPRKTSTRTMLGLINQGDCLGLVADQDARREGVWVRFLGQPSSRFRGGALFHLHSGAPLLFRTCLLGKDGRYRLSFVPINTNHLPDSREEAVRILTQRFFDILTEVVRRHPEQYFWFHRMWKTCPSGRSPTLAVTGTGRPGEPEPSRRAAEGTRPPGRVS